MVLFGGLWSIGSTRTAGTTSWTLRKRQRNSEDSNGADEPKSPQRAQYGSVRLGEEHDRGSTAPSEVDGLVHNAETAEGVRPMSDDDGESTPSLTSGFNGAFVDGEVLLLCTMYTAIYIVIAVIAYSYVFERWTIIDSIYFAVSTFTTCGYGDLQPTTEAGQVFTICFAIYGVIILGIFIGVFGHAISEAQVKAMKKLRERMRVELLENLFKKEGS
jgi:hypothetical protein